MKRFVLALALACALSATAMAGEIPSGGAPSPGEIPSGGAPIAGEIPSDSAPVVSPSAADTALLTAMLTILGLVV